jgi:hypothetical protein
MRVGPSVNARDRMGAVRTVCRLRVRTRPQEPCREQAWQCWSVTGYTYTQLEDGVLSPAGRGGAAE